MSTLVVIPARWGSTRFPGKPLAMIAGRPLLLRTIDLARRAIAGLNDVAVIVATDDHRIAALASSIGCETVQTEGVLSSGTARALAATRMHGSSPKFVVNLQGDAPFIPEVAVRRIIGALAAGARVATPVCQLSWADLDALRHHKRTSPYSGTTCVRDQAGDAIWFSKQIIPSIRNEGEMRSKHAVSPVFRHLGLYGYTREALELFFTTKPGHYEALEELEQLRFVELGVPIRTVLVDDQEIAIGGIDTPADLELANRLLASRASVVI